MRKGSKLKALLKDKGTFGKTVLKNFDKMKFENESEFDDFYAVLVLALEGHAGAVHFGQVSWGLGFGIAIIVKFHQATILQISLQGCHNTFLPGIDVI